MRTLLMCSVAAVATGAASAQTSTHPARPADQADRLLNVTSEVDGAESLPDVPLNHGEAYRAADDAQQDPAELRTTRALNDEIVSRNTLAANQERADQAAFERVRAEHEAAVARATADRLAYEEDVRQAVEVQRRWEAERVRWEADVRACDAGDRTRCAPPRPEPR